MFIFQTNNLNTVTNEQSKEPTHVEERRDTSPDSKLLDLDEKRSKYITIFAFLFSETYIIYKLIFRNDIVCKQSSRSIVEILE